LGGYYIQDATVTLTSGSKTETIAWDRDDLMPVTAMGFTDGKLSSVQSTNPVPPLPSYFTSEFYFRPWVTDASTLVNDKFYALSFFGDAFSTGVQARLSFADCKPEDGKEKVMIGDTKYLMVEAKWCKNFASSDSITYPALVKGPLVLSVPEPGTSSLTLAGLGAVAFMSRRRRRS
jgi:hypothetical protein